MTVMHRPTLTDSGRGWGWECSCGESSAPLYARDVEFRFISRDMAEFDHDSHVIRSDWPI